MKTMKTLLSVSMDGSVFCVQSLCLCCRSPEEKSEKGLDNYIGARYNLITIYRKTIYRETKEAVIWPMDLR